jgi:transposase
MTQVDDLSRSLVALDQASTLIVVVEMSLKSWLVAGLVPGLARQPLKKLEPDPAALAALLQRWREEAAKAGHPIQRTTVAFEAGRDGFWLARLLRQQEIEAYVIHSASVAVSREHRRAKTDRLDTQYLMRAFLGWLRGEPKHCQMAAIPTLDEEDARLPGRERDALVKERTRLVNRIKSVLIRFGIRGFKASLRNAAAKLAELRLPEGGPLPPHALAEVGRELDRLALVRRQIKAIEAQRLAEVKAARPAPDAPQREAAMLFILTRVVGIGVDTAQTLVREILSRKLRDRRALARYAGLTGSPDESGSKRREKGLARAGNARVRKSMIQLAWRFTMFQKNSALVQWFFARTAAAKGPRKTMIVALARKLLIALWRTVTLGVLPEGVVLRPA